MGRQLGVNGSADKPKANGCCTPREDKQPQKMAIPPKRVLPIVFLPGIMGSSLRMSAARQAELNKSDNIAWKPDRGLTALTLVNATPARRQMQLDPENTEVDIYDPVNNPTGNRNETADRRHDLGTIRVALNVGVETPLLTDEPKKTKETKARERGWGEVYFSSYRAVLEICEEALNQQWLWGHWSRVLNSVPKSFGAFPENSLEMISEKQHKESVAGCWFPVHAMGYNWLRSNADSAKVLSERINALIAKYQSQNYQCEKVIIVTHSMGGLVARALVHPDIGGLGDKVLGVVHGVMPAIGAPATYKRMRCGFEEAYGGLHPAPKVLGNLGQEVTAVLANAQGGLELLPSKEYGNDWLIIAQNDKTLLTLPQKGNPYNEIYKLRAQWFGLFREQWINPANRLGHGFDKTCELLTGAEAFHDEISGFYHQLSYAHYGADASQSSWEKITWNLQKKQNADNWRNLLIKKDNGQGRLTISLSDTPQEPDIEFSIDGISAGPLLQPGEMNVTLGPSTGPGDQTVPMRSADAQLRSGKFAGIFRQIGYEHQGSYDNPKAIQSTLYSLSRIISTMKWSKNE